LITGLLVCLLSHFSATDVLLPFVTSSSIDIRLILFKKRRSPVSYAMRVLTLCGCLPRAVYEYIFMNAPIWCE
jgi:hypothetical protein